MRKRYVQLWAGILGAVLLGSTAAAPVAVYAASDRLVSGEEAAEILLKNRQEDIIVRKPTSESQGNFPERLDLRDRGVVTPVKFQNPWGTCWGFSAIAAAETSILSELGKTYEETGLDLSEHHLTYFARTYMNDGSSQDGEGVYLFDNENPLDGGGLMFTATSLFSSGIGVVQEELVPYRGKESRTENLILKNYCYSKKDDWTLPDSYKFLQRYELENSDMLPSPAIYDSRVDPDEPEDMAEGDRVYVGYDQAATDRMKQALMDGYAISIAFAADTYSPEQLAQGEESLYLNVADNLWTHYTYDDASITHAVTIVGWDDTIKSTDFLDHSDDLWGDGQAHQPEGDGAWIVKNSWGAGTEEFPNKEDWGIRNEEGKSTGYFYLSYYDRSISLPEIFDFRVEEDENQFYLIDQYDYLQSDGTSGWLDETEIKTANIFTAEADETLRGLSCETNVENTEVTYEVYLLANEAETPEEGELALREGASYELPGYHRLDLSDTVSISEGQRYAVVLTQRTENEGTPYYAISTTVGRGKEAVEAYNREVKKYHGEGFEPYYVKGIVNPGESFVYLGELEGWSDFSEIVPCLQEDEFEGYEFDNFPIKAYLDYTNAEDQESTALEPLDYAPPKGEWNMVPLAGLVIAAAIPVLVIAALIILAVKNHTKKRRLKALEEEIAALKEALEAAKEAPLP